ncbi:MAG: 2-oxoglutarate oxidoreductase, partial [Firmicutes bacterium]|nr:2-oxoglutarate oxidoreductase [Bacillota bacterium]
MKTIFEYTKGMEADVSTSYCPGCTHGIAHRLIMEVLEERGQLQDTIAIAPVGCSIAAPRFMRVDMTEAFHGRAPAMATGLRRVHQDKVIFTYQGDGDLTSIGGNEILHAAERGEKFTTFFINNAIYGMTGGQMAPTTLVGQKATTAPKGRTVAHHGYPLRMCEIISQCQCAVFVERVALDTPAHVRQEKKAVEKA